MKPDRDLVAYFRRHLKKFGEDALTARLIEEGVDANQITVALTAAKQPPQTMKKALPLVISGLAILFACLYLAQDQKAPEKRTSPATPSSDPRPFLGSYGYVIQPPPGYESFSEFKDASRTREIVYFFPTGTDQGQFGHEGLYGQLGIIRLEVSPRKIPDGRLGLEHVKASVANNLAARKLTATNRELLISQFPAVLFNIAEPVSLVQTFIIGRRVLYVLTGGKEDQPYLEMLSSLQEVSAQGGL